MDDIDIYHIRVYGQVAAGDITDYCPPGLALAPDGPNGTRLSVQTDQAGLVALIRRLHGLGFRLLSIQSSAAEAASSNSQTL